jgi:hypothetical protein
MYWDEALELVKREYDRAVDMHPKFNSPHEGLAVITDQFRDLESQVFMPYSQRDPAEMQKEAIQVAAMAIRFIIDCTLDIKRTDRAGIVVNPTEGHGELL